MKMGRTRIEKEEGVSHILSKSRGNDTDGSVDKDNWEFESPDRGVGEEEGQSVHRLFHLQWKGWNRELAVRVPVHCVGYIGYCLALLPRTLYD